MCLQFAFCGGCDFWYTHRDSRTEVPRYLLSEIRTGLAAVFQTSLLKVIDQSYHVRAQKFVSVYLSRNFWYWNFEHCWRSVHAI